MWIQGRKSRLNIQNAKFFIKKQDIIMIGVIIKLSQTNEAIIGVGMGQTLQTKRFKHDFFYF